MRKAIVGKVCGENRPDSLESCRFGAHNGTATYYNPGGAPGDMPRETYLHFEDSLDREFAFGVKQDSRTTDVNRRALTPNRRPAFTISKRYMDRKALRARPQVF